MTLRLIIDFSDWSNLTKTDGKFTTGSNPCKFNSANLLEDEQVYTTTLPSFFENTDTRVLMGRIHYADAFTLANQASSMGFFVTDNTNWLGVQIVTRAGVAADLFRTVEKNSRSFLTPDNTESFNLNTNELKAFSVVPEYYWIKLELETDNSYKGYFARNYHGASKPDDSEWIELVSGSLAMGTLTEIGVLLVINPGASSNNVNYYWDDLELSMEYNNSPIGLDASIIIESYTLRTALNGGGNGNIVIPNPFFEVSATTLAAQLKKQLTYTNAFTVKQWEGETTTLDIGLDTVKYEVAEMIRKTMGVEVLASPIIFSTFIRQWNGLIIEDKDGGFISRGVTTNHIVAFAKADTKVYQGRATRDAFSIVDEDFVTPLVPDTINNGKDEEMYYKDKWDDVDTDKAHIMIHAADDLKWFAVKYPVDLYEKFNNLTKLNKLEIISTISAYREDSTENANWSTGAGDDHRYVYYLYNYQTSAYEKIQAFGDTVLKGDITLTSTGASANTYYYDPRDIVINIDTELKSAYSDWLIGTTYSSGDRAINEDILYTYIDGTPSSGQEPPGNKWQRTVYDFINYESTAGSVSIFSKLNIIPVIRTPTGEGNIRSKGIWVWDFSIKATFDEDNEPEYSTATINAVTATTITLDATAGINLPEKDGFGVGDVIRIVKNVEDYLQDSWDASPIATDLGALIIDITNSSTIGVLDDHTYKSFFSLMQHISELSNSTFWANYAVTNTVLISSADNHIASGVTLTKADLYNYNEGNWSISYDATKQKNKVRILGDNVNFIKTLSPALDPFDLGDETHIEDDNSIQTLLQASDKADALTPRMESNEVIVRVVLDYSNPNQNYTNVKVGSTIELKLPTVADTSIFNDTLLIMAIDLNRNEKTGDNEHATLSLQKRYS